MAHITTQSLQDALDAYLDKEVNILHSCAAIMMLVGVIVYVILLYIPATYGRYSSTKNYFLFWGIPARLAWFLQELPSFLVSSVLVLLVKFGGLPDEYTTPQLIVLGCYIFHYFQRYN